LSSASISSRFAINSFTLTILPSISILRLLSTTDTYALNGQTSPDAVVRYVREWRGRRTHFYYEGLHSKRTSIAIPARHSCPFPAHGIVQVSKTKNENLMER
jgi:hypothetical protein